MDFNIVYCTGFVSIATMMFAMFVVTSGSVCGSESVTESVATDTTDSVTEFLASTKRSGVLGGNTEADGAYNMRVNGGIHSVPNMDASEENTFWIARGLRVLDKVTVTGTCRAEPRNLKLSLETMNGQVAYDLYFDFKMDDVRELGNVLPGRSAIDLFPGSAHADQNWTSKITENKDYIFSIKFAFEEDNEVHVIGGSSTLSVGNLTQDLQQIRCVTVSGDVHKVESIEFRFS